MARPKAPPTQVAETGLVHYDKMVTAIAECHRIDEVKDLRDKAKALEVYAHQAQNLDAERKACEIRIRAERRAGELLREMRETGARHNGRGDQKSESRPTTPKLADLGITRDQSSKWQQLAAIPAEEFESAMNGDGPKPSTEGMLNARCQRDNPMKVMDADSLWFWGRLREFKARGILDRQPSDLISQMTDHMAEDCARLIPELREWLVESPKGEE